MTTNEPTAYSVPECNLALLTEQIAKLNKRGAKLGCEPIVLTSQHERTTLLMQNADGLTYWAAEGASPKKGFAPTGTSMRWFACTVIGKAPQFEGWTLCGVLEPLPLADGGFENMLKTVPGQSIPVEYAEQVGVCNHCNTKRFRKETFVVHSDTEGYKAVGRACLKDFLGHTSPGTLVSIATLLLSLDGLLDGAGDFNERDYCGGGAEQYDITTVLEITAASIQASGWLGRGTARDVGGIATADHVIDYMNPPATQYGSVAQYREWKQRVAIINEHRTDAQKERVAKAIEWAKEIQPGDNEYLANLNLAVRAAYVTYKQIGIVCSLLVAYDKAIENEINRAEQASRSNEFVGTVDDYLITDLTTDRIVTLENDWGTTLLHIMRDADGNSFKWFSSGSSLDVGETIRVRAKVKAHDLYEGRKQTVLTRVKEHVLTIELTDNMVVTMDMDTMECTQLKGRRRFVLTTELYENMKLTAEGLAIGVGADTKSAKAVLKRLAKAVA